MLSLSLFSEELLEWAGVGRRGSLILRLERSVLRGAIEARRLSMAVGVFRERFGQSRERITRLSGPSDDDCASQDRPK